MSVDYKLTSVFLRRMCERKHSIRDYLYVVSQQKWRLKCSNLSEHRL